LNFRPTSTGVGSPESPSGGVTLVPQSEQGHVTVTTRPAPGVWMLPLSSAARVLIVEVGEPWTVHE
jgi:hypothetical protein